MRAGEAEHRENDGEREGNDDLGSRHDVPRDVNLAVSMSEPKRDAQVDHRGGKVRADLQQHGQSWLLVLSDVPEDACIFNSQTKT